MSEDSARTDVPAVGTAAADRLDALADIAELMGDDAGAEALRARASHVRLHAMSLLDE